MKWLDIAAAASIIGAAVSMMGAACTYIASVTEAPPWCPQAITLLRYALRGCP